MSSFLLRPAVSVLFASALLPCAWETSLAQTTSAAQSALTEASLTLPEAPTPAYAETTSLESSSLESAPVWFDLQTSGNPAPRSNPSGRSATPISPTDLTVSPGDIAPSQTARDKMVGSVKDAISPFSLIGETISAGYSHLTNGSPNYGTDAPAFGQRFGASVARGTSQNIFSEGVLAAVLHEDPRYYQMGPGKPFFKRLVYAGTRPLITRTDSGRSTPNLAVLGGYLGAAALTKAYYPPLNQGFSQTLQTYGGSIGGAALGYVVSEFLSNSIPFVHLKKEN